VWAVTATAGFESAWADRDGLRLHAKGRVVGQLPQPDWLSYELFTDQDAATTRLTVTAITSGKAHRLDLARAEDADRPRRLCHRLPKAGAPDPGQVNPL
jgi:hypothetical protein